MERKKYIYVSREIESKWRNKIIKKNKNSLIVGIHWQGNPDFEKHMYSSGRSMPASMFKILSGIENIEFLILQKGKHRHDYRNEFGLDLVKAQDEFDKTFDFRETAGAMMSCDLIISADSSVVHLAGALGIKTWVLLNKVPEWRWGLEGKKSIWYDSLTLYRQK